MCNSKVLMSALSDHQMFVIESPWMLLTIPVVNQLGTGHYI
ncbi:Uncharacterised protein [Klebsiella pneumoniae]|nr:hypothetical protein AD94_05167 [Klebsiella variicola]SVW24752.1 Uncharacterised protein [Klebsiella pneumoniae]SWN38858.1 Uncharacterised protein [Klebsiella pneumoniae]SWN56301.1 Uncharacterised protein [Klebsiella pneumoniae]SWN74507.1 Uncharacterised protein [Klebsiella pneumoniae]